MADLWRWRFDVGPYEALGTRFWTVATVRAATYDDALAKAMAKTLRRAKYKEFVHLHYHLASVTESLGFK